MPGQSWSSDPSFTVTREVARKWRDEGLAEFINKGRAIHVKNVRLPRVRARREPMAPCKVCGGVSSQRLCPRCRLDGIQDIG
jgi:hypothetical protein